MNASAMNEEEKRILHGLYYDRQMIDEKKLYRANEINWLAKHSFREGEEWQDSNGKLQSIEDKKERSLEHIGAVSAASVRPLAHLEKCGYISLEREAGFFRIALTGAGVDLARQLHTRWGRLNLRYKKHKDGILGLLVTVVVSMVTTLVTNKYLK